MAELGRGDWCEQCCRHATTQVESSGDEINDEGGGSSDDDYDDDDYDEEEEEEEEEEEKTGSDGYRKRRRYEAQRGVNSMESPVSLLLKRIHFGTERRWRRCRAATFRRRCSRTASFAATAPPPPPPGTMITKRTVPEVFEEACVLPPID